MNFSNLNFIKIKTGHEIDVAVQTRRSTISLHSIINLTEFYLIANLNHNSDALWIPRKKLYNHA